jgi:hypothetical protein
MSIKTTLGILGGIAAILLVLLLLSAAQGSGTPAPLAGWTRAGMVTSTNSTVTLSVGPANETASISRTVNVTMPTTLVMSWTDLAQLQSATYQVDVIRNGTTIVATPISAANSGPWVSAGEAYKLAHDSQVDLGAGSYKIVYSLQGQNGTVGISQISVQTNLASLIFEKVGGYIPYLLLVAIIAGWATYASGFSSLKRDVERLRTLLSLKG